MAACIGDWYRTAKYADPRFYANCVPWVSYWYQSFDPRIGGLRVIIHETPDGRYFVGARSMGQEAIFKPRFFPTAEAAMLYVKLVAE